MAVQFLSLCLPMQGVCVQFPVENLRSHILVAKKPEHKQTTEAILYPAIPLLGIHTEETRIERDTCTPVFIAALFIIARTWKQPRCPSADEWI